MSARSSPADSFAGYLVGFGRALRAAGLAVDSSRVGDALAALEAVGTLHPDTAYWALRVALVSRIEEIDRFDRLFASWFLIGSAPDRPQRSERETWAEPAVHGTRGTDAASVGNRTAGAGWSPDETLRHKDFALLTPAELTTVAAAIARLASGRPQRRARRLGAGTRGDRLDVRRTLRSSLRTAGDPAQLVYARRVMRPRKLVLLCDVSGSMEAHVRPILLFAHALLHSGRDVEVMAFGTRVTRLTEDLLERSAEVGLKRVARHVLDWSGGTRIGDSLKTYNDTWGVRAPGRGAVVVVVSDGWERDSVDAVSREMARLALTAYAVVWVNPLKGHPGYQPLAAGMRAALPFVDWFLPGNDLASLEELVTVLSQIDRRRRAPSSRGEWADTEPHADAAN